MEVNERRRKVDEFLNLLHEQTYDDLERVITVLLNEMDTERYPELETFLDELYDLTGED